MNHNLYAVFAERFAGALDQACLELEDGTTYSYAQLDAESARYANLLTSRGLKPGSSRASDPRSSITSRIQMSPRPSSRPACSSCERRRGADAELA